MPYNTLPRPKGPHLNALRAFEAAARLESFVAAAEELCVTPGAIAQHIKSLEAWAGARLFIRNTKGVALTSLGADLIPKFTLAFDKLGDAVEALRSGAAPDKLRIATLPAIAQLWLSERLGKLRALEPGLTVSVYAFEAMPNPRRDPFDVMLFFSNAPLANDETALFQDRIYPVCTPGLADQIKDLDSLKSLPLLKDAAWHGDWELWLKSNDNSSDIVPEGPQFSLFSVALEETLNGAGVLMAHEALIRKYLDQGQLVAPFDHRLLLDRTLVMKAAPAIASGPYFKGLCRVLTGSG